MIDSFQTLEEYELDGSCPLHVLRPETEAQCGELVLHARAEGSAVVPWGGGTARHQGNRLRPSRWNACAMEGLAGVTEYTPDDMVVTALAGTKLSALQKELETHNQCLPLDAPQPDLATLGGIVATNAQGLWRPIFGTPRDRLLGLRVVMADGQVIKGGGKVVKNVAGYDLCKLFAGSWGTLGLIYEVTFKTSPRPDTGLHLVYSAPSMRSATEAALMVHTARLQPLYLTAVSVPTPRLCVGLQGGVKSVAWQQKEIVQILEKGGLQRAEDRPTEDELRHLLVRATSAVTACISARPTDLREMVDHLSTDNTTLICHIPTGILEVSLDTTANADQDVLETWPVRMPPHARLVWTRVPMTWKDRLDVWGPTRGDIALMRRIKAALDPHGLFSPGRFVGRI